MYVVQDDTLSAHSPGVLDTISPPRRVSIERARISVSDHAIKALIEAERRHAESNVQEERKTEEVMECQPRPVSSLIVPSLIG